MNLRRQGILFATLLASTVAHAEDCTPKHKFKTIAPGILTQAATTYMPFSAIDTDGTPIGVDGEIVKEIAKMECLTVKAVPVDSAAAMNYVISGRADLTTGSYYRTEERAKVVALTDPTYLDQMAIVSATGTGSFNELEGKRVGAVQGDLWVADLKKVFGTSFKGYPAQAQLVQDLEAGRLDAIIVGYAVAKTAQSKGQMTRFKAAVAEKDERIGSSVSAGQANLPMSKNNEDMLKAINEDIAELHKSGFIAKALEKYGLDGSAAETGAPRLLK
jgi:polar amino acid transport system substrate-binding protein